jgi:hypothetical protein
MSHTMTFTHQDQDQSQAHPPPPSSPGTVVALPPSFLNLAHPQTGDGHLCISDLELLYHFSTSTCFTLTKPSNSSKLWQFDVPQLAFANPFLLHQVLSIAAFHLAYLRPQKRDEYVLLASQHQNLAVQGMRLLLPDISAENCHPLFIASQLLCFAKYAGFSAPLKPAISDLLDVFQLIRGMGNIISTKSSDLIRGPLRAIFRPAVVPDPNANLLCIIDRVVILGTHIAKSGVDERLAAVVQTEIQQLLTWINHGIETSANAELRIVGTWPMTMSDEYLTLLRQSDSVALALLSYYCVLLRVSEEDFWFMQGWSTNIMKAVTESVQVPWDNVARWCLERVTCLSDNE